MSDATKLTAQQRIDAANKRRQSTKDAEAAAKLEQAATDIEAIADLESTHGYDRVIAIGIDGVWKPGMGAPTRIAVRVPLGSDGMCKRFIDQINRAKEGSKDRILAQDSLAIECWIYPEKGSDAYQAAIEIAPMILSNAALQIVKAAQGVAEAEGKG